MFKLVLFFQGTRTLVSIVNHDAVIKHGHMMEEKKTYILSKYSVAEPGYGIHDRFHVRLDKDTEVKVVNTPFVDRVFSLRTPSDLPTDETYVGSIYGYVIIRLFFLYNVEYIICSWL